ncbi:MAG TPA: hotdog fold domain-containing protein [Blastocatellia bacterium]|nr:hotdog fold domain-containing protein [Blastocatellia bacterium]
MSAQREQLSEYRVRARNIATDSENKIHDDHVAAEFGFGGGLVPGVAVYAYMTVPLVERFGLDWLEHGAIKVRFRRPFYEGQEVIVKAESGIEDSTTKIDITASREDGELCATALASIPFGINENSGRGTIAKEFQDRPMPSPEFRLAAERSSLVPGTALGTIVEKLDLANHQQTVLREIQERLSCYFGPKAVPHPIITLSLANHILMQNVALGPWIHSSSEVEHYSLACDGDPITVRGRITECFERNGNDLVVLDLLLSAANRPISRVSHSAIYRIRKAASG